MVCDLFDEAVGSYEVLFPRFERVWLGVAGGPTGSGGYCESWLEPGWVAGLVARVRGAGRLVSKRIGGKAGSGRFGWYFSHEGFIEHLHEGCRAQNGTFVPAAEFATAFIGGMAAAVGELRRLEPAWPILWSPSARENPGHALDELAFAELPTDLREPFTRSSMPGLDLGEVRNGNGLARYLVHGNQATRSGV